MRYAHIIAIATLIAAAAPVSAKMIQSPYVPNGSSAISERVYAQCTKDAAARLSPVPKSAAHFDDMVAQQAYECAVVRSNLTY